jgi:ligand-binding sensor domain-containing protein
MFTSCSGAKNTPTVMHTPVRVESTTVFGDTVSEMNEGLWLVFQDQNENYWFGSKEMGAYRFDGENSVHFTKKDGLISNAILGIQEDKIGNIYFDTPEGVSKFDGKQFTTLPVIKNTTGKNEWKLANDDLWFRMGWDHSGPYRYDGEFLYELEFLKTDQEAIFRSKVPNASFNPYGIYSMYRDSKGTMWFGTSSLGAARYDGKTTSWLFEEQLTDTPEGGSFGIRSMIEDKTGAYWFCNTQYRYAMLPDNTQTLGNKKVNYDRLSGVANISDDQSSKFPYFMSITEDKQGNLWMATYSDGVWRNDGTKLIHYPINYRDIDVLLFSIYTDKNGELWLGSHNAGAFKFNGEKFERFEL